MTTAPRVLAVCPGDGAGSSMVFVRRQCESLRKLGLDIELVYVPISLDPASMASQLIRLSKTIEDSGATVVHAHYGTATALLCVLASRVPVVITFRGSDLNPSPAVSRVRSLLGRLLSQLAAAGASRVICVSAQLAGRLWTHKNDVLVLPTGVDTALFRPGSRAQARERLNWDPYEPVVMFNSGRDPRIKRRHLALEVMGLVRRKLPHARLLELDGSVPPEQIPLIMVAADCLLLTSRSEGSPNVVKEALACELPIVSVDVGDVAERTRGVAGCRIVEPFPESLARTVVAVLRSGQRADGRHRALEVSETAVAQKLRGVYYEVSG